MTVAAIEEAAQHAANSQYLNDWSAIRIKNQSIKDKIAKIGHQSYIAQAPLLYVFVADEHRNAAVATKAGVHTESDEFTLNSTYRLIQSHNDAVLALHAMETAAESLGLGCVILGTVLNDTPGLIELLHLPKYTYPVLGLAIGKPDQEPAIKPRLKRSAQFFDDAYPEDDGAILNDMGDFDQEVHRYYDLRRPDRPVEKFSDQIASKSVDRGVFKMALTKHAPAQGFDLER